MYKILTLNQIAEKGLERLPRGRFEVGSEIRDPDAILVRSAKLTGAHVTPRLRAVARAGAGVNNIPVADYTGRGIVVFNTPGANANSVKELVIAALLASSRGVLEGIAFVRSLAPAGDAASSAAALDAAALDAVVEREKNRFRGREVAGRTLGVVGLGAIGALVAQAGLHLGMRVLGHDPAISVDAAWRLPAEVQRIDNLHALFARSDYVTLHVPLLPETRDMVNAESLKSFRPDAVLLNFARAEIVDAAAVAAALAAGRLRRYFADFPAPALHGVDGAVLTPHLGASTDEAEENCAVMAAEQLRAFLDHGNIRNSVNFPDVLLERSRGYRIAVTNRNVPGMLGRITSIIADGSLNVVDMINKSRGDVAYNLLDTEAEPGPGLLARLGGIDGVINVRLFEPV
jgi:D-3-phosphoglycerate dehydrogenase